MSCAAEFDMWTTLGSCVGGICPDSPDLHQATATPNEHLPVPDSTGLRPGGFWRLKGGGW